MGHSYHVEWPPVVDPDPSTLYDGTGSAVSEGEDSQDSDSDLESLLGDGLHLPSHITPARGWDDRAHRTSKKKSAFAHVPKCFRVSYWLCKPLFFIEQVGNSMRMLIRAILL